MIDVSGAPGVWFRGIAAPTMTTPPVAMLVTEGLGERVYKSIRDLILSQTYPPGTAAERPRHRLPTFLPTDTTA